MMHDEIEFEKMVNLGLPYLYEVFEKNFIPWT